MLWSGDGRFFASKGGVGEKNDSPRGSRSGGTGETAEGRIRGLKGENERLVGSP